MPSIIEESIVYPTSNHFHIADYVVFAMFMLISLGVGVFFSLWGGRQRSTSEYLMGNRQMGAIPVGISIAVSFVSALTLVGHPAEIYIYGYMYIYSGIGLLVGFLCTSLLFVQLFYPLNLTSPNEYLQGRYKSPAVAIIGNLMATVSTCLYMGLCMYAPAIALSKATNGVLPVIAAYLIGGAIGTTYTTIGGLKAVVWSDVIQSTFMLVGMIAMIVRGLSLIGGLDTAIEINRRYERIHTVDVSPDPRVRHTLWGMLIGGAFDWGSVVVMPASVQRMCSLPTLKDARVAFLCAAPTMAVLFWLSSLAGLSIFGYYLYNGCDIHTAGWTSDVNEISPYFVMDQLNYPGFPGLFIAAMYAGSLSTLSSGLSATSAALWKDIMKPYIFRKTSDFRGAVINKIVVFVTGIISIALGYGCMQTKGLVLQTLGAIDGSIRGPYYGLFWLSALVPFANKYGAFAGPLAGFVVCLWLNLGTYLNPKSPPVLPSNITNCATVNVSITNSTTTLGMMSTSTTDSLAAATTPSPANPVYQISYIWILGIGAATTVIVGMIASAVTCGWKEEVDERYIWGPCRPHRPAGCSGCLKMCCLSERELSGRNSKYGGDYYDDTLEKDVETNFL